MPIYAYRCESCGHAKDVLQKMSDPLLTVCPACGQPAFKKQVTAAGFQLKGSGWYVTDFRGDNKSGAPAEPKDAQDAKGGEAAKPATDGAKAPAASDSAVAGSSAAPAAAPAPAPAKPAASSPSSSSGTGSGSGTGAGSQ